MSGQERIQTVQVDRPYDIIVGAGLLKRAGELCRAVNTGTRSLIVSDSHVAPLYAGDVAASLRAAGYDTAVQEFPAGEAHKRLDTVAGMYERLADCQLTRRDLVVALGGGVTGDMAGFAAATWLRGVDVVQMPTSLLAQVDSSVGGKTGVDIARGKNLVGAFWQPARVLADTATLDTLPPDYLTDGMGEVIKTAAIGDAALFAALEDGDALSQGHRDETIAACIAVKRGIVERDEHEAGERKLLNFGHTLGHALETHYQYAGLSHGRAVAVGMQMITDAAEARGLTCVGTAARLRAVLTRWGLPTNDPAPREALWQLAALDKKRDGDNLDLVLLRKIGQAYVQRVSLKEVSAW